MSNRKQQTAGRIHANISPELHKRAKAVAALHNMTLASFIEDAIRCELEKLSHRELSDLTKETLDKSLRGEDLYEYNSLEDFFREMREDEA